MSKLNTSSSLLLCFPKSSSTPSLAGAASVAGRRSSLKLTRSSKVGSSILSGVYFFFLLFTNIALLCTGSLFLSWIERPGELFERHRLHSLRNEFVAKHLFTLNATRELDLLIGSFQNAAQKGILSTYPNGEKLDNSAWSFGSSLLFLTTVATTVGYGHAAPQSSFGKAFSMIYGTIAIPLLLAFFGEVVRKLVWVLNWLFSFSISHRCPESTSGAQHSIHVGVKVAFVLFISFSLIFATTVIPAFIFTALEPWSMLDALYYCFISMTTVGLGDVIPGEGYEWNKDASMREIYHISIAVYLLVALPFFFLAIKLISGLVSTAEMSFRAMPICMGIGDRLADFGEGSHSPSQCPKRAHGKIEEESDEYDDYDVSSHLLGAQFLEEGSDCETDAGKKVAASLSTDVNTGSFTCQFPQPK